jgi:type I restriction enzyme S subunit
MRFADVGQLDRGRSRHRPRDAAELYGGQYPFIQTGDVANSGGYISRYTQTYSEAGLAQSRLWDAGTLCITIAANIANTGILQFDACFPDSVVGFVPNNLVTTEYIRGWLSFLQPTIEANAPQAAQKNINLEILRNLPVPVPPIDIQQRYNDQCASLYSIRNLSYEALMLADNISRSLASNSFSNS